MGKLRRGEAREVAGAERLLARLQPPRDVVEVAQKQHVARGRRRHRRRRQVVPNNVAAQPGARAVPAAVRPHAARLRQARQIPKVVEQPVRLERAQPRQVERGEVCAIEQHGARVRVIEALQQRDHRRLATTRRAHQSADLAWLDRQAESAQDLAGGSSRVGKVNLLLTSYFLLCYFLLLTLWEGAVG